MIHPSSANYKWYVMADPGNSGSAFAVLFLALDIYRPRVFCVDEIYETNPTLTTAPKIGKRILSTCRSFHEDLTQWEGYYDSAAAWFGVSYSEFYHKDGLVFVPVKKPISEKEDNLDTISDLIDNRELIISARCPSLIWELDNYKRINGKIQANNDHQIDNLRYFTKTAGVFSGNSIMREDESRYRTKHKRRRFVSLETDMKNAAKGDLIQSILNKYGEDT